MENKLLHELESWQDPNQTPYVRIENLCKNFDDVVAVDDVNLSIYKGELFSLLGGSGSGKTTLLRMLAGFEKPTSGKIFIDDTDMTKIPPFQRPVGMMFQSYALFPHMNVTQNIAFGLKQEGLSKSAIASKISDAVELLHLSQLTKRMPHQLSGGQKQRVALARSIVKQPKLLLLDEPLAALDKKLREKTQFELVNLQEQLGLTFMIVTHDQDEAMAVSNRIAVMDNGWIQQIGTPHEIYEYPINRHVAEFVGSTNIIEARIDDLEGSYAKCISPDFDKELSIKQATPIALGTEVLISIRPEKIKIEKRDDIDESKNPDKNMTYGVVEEIAYLGDISNYIVKTPHGKILRALVPNKTPKTEMPIVWGDHVRLTWQAGSGVILTQ